VIQSEIILYVTKDKKQKFKSGLMEARLLEKTLLEGKAKIVYFEKFENSRTAKSRFKKMQSLKRDKLVELIEESNPEMLNLINCI